MADRNPLWVSHAGGVVTIDDARIGISSLWTPGSSNVNSRAGLRPAGSTAAAAPGLVAQQTVADKTVKVNAYQAVIPASRATGSFICTLDAAKNIDLLTLHPAHASLQRNDLIVAQVSDETFDSANGFSTFQVVGTPSGTPTDPVVNTTNGAPTNSPDYIVLARVRVTAGASTITTSMIDLFPNGKQWVTALGGVLPVLNATDRATLTPYDGMAIWRIDRKWVEYYSIAAGGWIVDGPALGSSAADLTSAITTPQTAQRAFVGDIPYYYDGTAWVVEPGQLVAGQYRSSAPAAIGGTETQILSVAVTLDRNSMYVLEFNSHAQVSTPNCDFDMRIRDTNLTGTIIAEKIIPRNADAYPVGDNVKILFQNATGSPVAKTFVATIQRIVGTGTYTMDIGYTYLSVTKVAPSGRFSAV